MALPVVNVAAGDAHAMAVSVTGAVYAWGRNQHGQLGIPRSDVGHASLSPRRVPALADVGATVFGIHAVSATPALPGSSRYETRRGWTRVWAPDDSLA